MEGLDLTDVRESIEVEMLGHDMEEGEVFGNNDTYSACLDIPGLTNFRGLSLQDTSRDRARAKPSGRFKLQGRDSAYYSYGRPIDSYRPRAVVDSYRPGDDMADTETRNRDERGQGGGGRPYNNQRKRRYRGTRASKTIQSTADGAINHFAWPLQRTMNAETENRMTAAINRSADATTNHRPALGSRSSSSQSPNLYVPPSFFFFCSHSRD